MFFGKKYDRAMDVLKEKNNRAETGTAEDIEVKPDEKEDKEEVFEKNDRLAMTISAFLVFIPAAVLILGIFALLSFLIGI